MAACCRSILSASRAVVTRSELYSAITLAFSQQVVPGNQLLLWPNRGTRIAANAEPRREGMQLILSVSR
jgi:hypothetical protein